MVRRYIKKPVEIEAIKYTGHNGWYIEEWSKNMVILNAQRSCMKTSGCFETRACNGATLNIGDYVIKDRDGDFYFYTGDYFESEYDML